MIQAATKSLIPPMVAAASLAGVYGEFHYQVVNQSSAKFETVSSIPSDFGVISHTSRNSIMTPVGNRDRNFVNPKMEAAVPGWLQVSVLRLRELAEESSGLSEVKRSAAQDSVKAAFYIIKKLARAGLKARPAIGWDGDEVVGLNGKSNGLTFDISVFPNGTYSYFAIKEDGRSAFADAELVVGPLARDFEDLLS